MQRTIRRDREPSRSPTARRCRLLSGRAVGSLRRSRSGQSLVEFAFVLPVLLFVMLGFFEFGRLMYTRLTVRHAVMGATRFAITGNQLPDSTDNPLSRAESVEQIILEKAVGLSIEVTDIDMSPPDGGGPEEVVSIELSYTYDFFLPYFESMLPPLDFTVTTSMKNEPFYN